MKYISFTLYGNNDRYFNPLIIIAKYMTAALNNWKLIVYHDQTVPEKKLGILEELGYQLVNVTHHEYLSGLPAKLWRYYPIFEPLCDVLLVRDSDSVITDREMGFVNNWLKTDMLFHIIRDHPLHVAPILAGLFGVKKAGFEYIKTIFRSRENIVKSRPYNYDQVILARYVYKTIIPRAMVHSSSYYYKNENVVFTEAPDVQSEFIGAVHGEGDSGAPDLIQYEKRRAILPYWLLSVFGFSTRISLMFSIKEKKNEQEAS